MALRGGAGTSRPQGKDLLYRGTYGQLTKAEEGVRIGVPNICRNGLCGAQLSAGDRRN